MIKKILAEDEDFFEDEDEVIRELDDYRPLDFDNDHLDNKEEPSLEEILNDHLDEISEDDSDGDEAGEECI